MSDLRLDLDALAELSGDLGLVKSSFESIDQVSRTLASAVGHELLAGRVLDFASKWDDRRATIISSLESVSESARSIATTFQDVDRGIGDALSQQS